MSSGEYELEFDGYWREINAGGIPEESGIYCVYTCTHRKEGVKNSVLIDQLIYIGESSDVRDRIKNHELKPNWMSSKKSGQTLCYNFAPISSGRERAEAALIYKHKPEHNTKHKDSFLYPETSLEISGKKAELSKSFTVTGTP